MSESKMPNVLRPFSWPLALTYFLIAYVLVTLLAAGSSEFYRALTDAPYAHELGLGLLEDPAFQATVPVHVLIMGLIFTPFAWLFLRQRRSLISARLLSWVWLTAAVIVDFVGFVAIDHGWSLSAEEFYLDYQPWITLIYLAIFGSPHLAWLIME
jgi:hypothetical protein